MRKKLLGKDIVPACLYCVHGVSCAVEGEVLCSKRGVMHASSSCRKYRYDPLKRRPERPKKAEQEPFEEDAFKL